MPQTLFTTPPSVKPAVTKTPETLSRAETGLAWALVFLGVALIVGVLIWFGATTPDSNLVSKTVETTEEGGAKTITETDYAETVVLFALTIGAAFTLAGAFYNRLREITLGGVILKVGPTDEQKGEVGKKAEDAVREQAPDQAEALAPVAKAVAEDQLEARSLLTLTEPTEGEIEKIAEASASRVVEAASSTSDS